MAVRVCGRIEGLVLRADDLVITVGEGTPCGYPRQMVYGGDGDNNGESLILLLLF